MEALIAIRDFATDFFNMDPDRVSLIPMAGSSRVYVRLFFAHGIFVGTFNPDIKENKTFIYLSKTLSGKGINVPKVIAVSDDNTMYLQDDLGQMDAYSLLVGAKDEEKNELLKEIIDSLVEMQLKCRSGIDFLRCHPSPVFGYSDVMFDLRYFEKYFLKGIGEEYDADLIQKDFEKIAFGILNCNFVTFMYRDFQSRNIMVRDNDIGFIDFQGGRRGPGVYDLISLIYQAKLELNEVDRPKLIEYYFDKISYGTNIKTSDLSEDLNAVRIVRLLQVLGAYGLRGIIEKKTHFISSISPAIDNLRVFTNDVEFGKKYPYLNKVLSNLIKNKADILCRITD